MDYKHFYEVWKDHFKSSHVAYNHRTFEVENSHLVEIGNWLRNECNACLLDAFAVEDKEHYLLHYTFDFPKCAELLTLCSRIDMLRPEYLSLSHYLHAADWYERELYETSGIIPKGHPLLGGFIFHDADADVQFPLRKQKRSRVLPPEFIDDFSKTGMQGTGVFDMPLGPVYSGVSESGLFNLSSIGEEIFWVKPRLFYKHRGLEKTAEKQTPEQAVLIAERIAGTTSVSESLAFCQAVEEIAGIEVPQRALFIRSIFTELERIYNHVSDITAICESTSLRIGTAQGWILKERLLRLNASLTGHRYLMGVNRIGGVRIDLGKQKFYLIENKLNEFTADFKKWIKLLLSTNSFMDRLEGIGVLKADAASDLCSVGPVGRASKVDRDFRRDHPYAAYSQVRFEVPVMTDGDCLARLRVRHVEVEQSLLIIRQLQYLLPRGPVENSDGVEFQPGSSAYGFCEGPRGNTMQWLSISENGLIWRWRARTPSLVNWQTIPLAANGSAFQDFPIILASFGLSHAECGR